MDCKFLSVFGTVCLAIAAAAVWMLVHLLGDVSASELRSEPFAAFITAAIVLIGLTVAGGALWGFASALRDWLPPRGWRRAAAVAPPSAPRAGLSPELPGGFSDDRDSVAGLSPSFDSAPVIVLGCESTDGDCGLDSSGSDCSSDSSSDMSGGDCGSDMGGGDSGGGGWD
jgi:hypothetical protein